MTRPAFLDAVTTRARAPLPRGMLMLAVLLVVFAFNLRLIFPSVSVLLPEIARGLGLSDAGTGYLTTLPVLCLGLFAPLAPWCARRLGMERTLLLALALLALSTAARGLGGSWGLFLGSVVAGGCIAVANVLLPSLVKRDFPRRVALMTGLYTMALNGGAAVAAAFTVPLVLAAGASWRLGVMVWALPPAIVALLWIGRAWHPVPRPAAGRRSLRGLWRSPLAWQVTGFMGLQSATAYCVSGWLAPILRARGLDGTTAGWVTSVCILMNATGSLLIPLLLSHARDQRVLNVGLAVLAAGPLLGLLFAPLSTVWFWAVLQGLGQGAMFTAALTVIVLRAADSEVAAGLSSMAQTVGYMVAAAGPLLVGLLQAWTGGFAASGWLFVAICVGASLCGWRAGRARHVELDQPPQALA